MLVMFQNLKNHTPSEFCNVVIFKVFEKHKQKLQACVQTHLQTHLLELAKSKIRFSHFTLAVWHSWEFNRRLGQFDPLPISESVNIIICHHCSETPSPPPLTSSVIFYLMYSPPHNPRLVE